jgi:hypothetical protein
MKTLSDTIVLNNTFDASEESVDFLQFRFALAMYTWKRKKGLWWLVPSKKGYFETKIPCIGTGCFIMLFLVLAGMLAGLWWLGIATAVIVNSIYWGWTLNRRRKVWKNLPKKAIAVINPARSQITIRRIMPCVQIPSKKLVLNFDDIEYADFKVAFSVLNGDGKIFFKGDSDAMIVKGLIAVVLSIYNNKSPSEIKAVAVENIFAKLGLKEHLSPSRRNGLLSMTEKIRYYAEIL